jgi:hypothetical protein
MIINIFQTLENKRIQWLIQHTLHIKGLPTNTTETNLHYNISIYLMSLN